VVVDAVRVFNLSVNGDAVQNGARLDAVSLPSVAQSVGRGSLVNVTYLTAADGETDACPTSKRLEFSDNRSRLPCPDGDRLVSVVSAAVATPRTLTVYTDGRWIEIKQPSFGAVSGGGQRGAVTTFSPQSRRRFMKKIYILQSSSRCLWITLTQPAAFVGSIGARRMQKLFVARVRRAFPTACGLWRIQPQKRGAPHFHFMIYGVAFDGLDVKSVRANLSRMWTAVVIGGIENGDKLSARSRGQIARYGCDVAEMNTSDGVQRYASRYLSRTDAAGNAAVVGRQWGAFNRDALPVSIAETVTVSRAVAQNVVRAARRAQTRTFVKRNGHAVKWSPKYRTTSSASFIGQPSTWSRYADVLSNGVAPSAVSPVVVLDGRRGGGGGADGRDAVSRRVRDGRQTSNGDRVNVRNRHAVVVVETVAPSVAILDAVSVSRVTVQTVE